MKRLFYNTIALLYIVLGLFSTSCSDNVVIDEPEPGIVVNEDGTFSVTATLNVQRISSVTSRAMADTPSEGLTVKALEFSWNADIANSTLTNVYDVEVVSPTTGVANTSEVEVKLTLKATTDPTILQFIVTDADLGTINYGSMASILQSLWVSKNEDTKVFPEAYFGQLTLDNGYGKTEIVSNGDGTSSSKFTPFGDLNDRLKAIPLVRNFAKISCTENIQNFELTGFALVNVPTAGTVAPWDPIGNRLIDMIKDGKMIPYQDLPEGYVGMLAPSSQFEDTEADIRNGKVLDFSTEPRYTYAHPYEPVRRTYMIVRGRYNGSTTDTYYKIDLGYTDTDTQLFTYYNIIRNYHYKVTINSVNRAGYPTVLDAINGAVFNNLSASTETRDMLSLSDGENMIGVNMTRAVITNTNPVRFAYNYKTDVDKGAGTTPDNQTDIIKVIGLDPVNDVGPDKVLEAIVGPEVVGDSVFYTLTPNPPGDITKQQTFTVVDPGGLGRTVTLVSRIPWTMSDIDVYGQAVNERPDDKVETDSVGASSGEPLTLFFNLPDGIPESVFPLKFTIESNRQNIENNSAEGASLVVTTAPSMFSATDDPRVAYIKTVTYEQYLYMPDENNQIDVEGAKNPDHTVRCRFRTTIGLSNIPGEPNEMLTRLKIYNPYFNMGEVSFVRKKGQ